MCWRLGGCKTEWFASLAFQVFLKSVPRCSNSHALAQMLLGIDMFEAQPPCYAGLASPPT